MCGYRKRASTQQVSLFLIETWKKVLDGKGYGGAVLMDLSKAFDTINYDLLLAKLHELLLGVPQGSVLDLYHYFSIFT